MKALSKNPTTKTLTSRERVIFCLERLVAIFMGWCVGMFAAYGEIIANAKIGSGPQSHPTATWFVGIRSSAMTLVLAVFVCLPAARSGRYLLLGATIGFAMPLVTLFWLYR